MRTRRYLGFVLACLICLTQGCWKRGPAPGSIRWRIQLVPRTRRARSGKLTKALVKDLKDATLEKVAAKGSFPKWRTHEDEYLSFSYPDDPHIKLETKKPGDRIPIMGGPLRTAGITFLKSYRLALGRHTYCLLMLDRNDEFDDSICMCGAVVYDKYLFHNGALYRFSFLGSGEVKRVQLLCNGLRVVLFERTHLPIHEDVYLDIALSVKMRNGPCDEDEMKKAVFAKYGFEGRLGFLEKGMTKSDVTELLGVPRREHKGILYYLQRHSYEDGRGTYSYETTTRLDLRRGSFAGFGKNWRRARELPPERGTPEWILAKARYKEGMWRAEDYDLGPLNPDEVKYVFDRIVALLPEASSNHWGILCQAVHALHAQGLKDKRVLPAIRARYLEDDLRMHQASWILHIYDPDGSRDLFLKRIRLTLDGAKKRAASLIKKEQSLTLAPYDDLHNLLSFLGKTHPQRVDLIIEAMDHPHSQIRSDAYFFWDSIPREVARPRLIKGLKDRNVYVRDWSARAFAKGFGAPKDLLVLRERRAEEPSQRIRETLESAIKRLEELEEE